MNNVFKLMFLLIMVSAVLTSCQKGSVKKPDDSTSSTPPLSIIGTWQLNAEKGPDGGNIKIPVGSTTYSFGPDSTYAHTPDNNSGKFHITKQVNIFTHNKQDYITFSNTDFAGLLTVGKDTLTISDNHADPDTYIYVKEKIAN